MPSTPQRILITGANGHLGRQLIERIGRETDPPFTVRALVRSERAAEQVRAVSTEDPPEVVIGDYTDEAAMAEAVADCVGVVHLVGIIKEGRGASYRAAHEETCEVLVRVAEKAAVGRIVYLSIFGSAADSSNPCLASKGRAEDMLLEGPTPTTILRVPMVLGPGDFASAALRGQARSGLLFMVGGGRTIQQPIDSADVLSAVLAALAANDNDSHSYDIGGPERLTHRALVAQAASLYGKSPTVVPVPLALARGFAGLLSSLLSNPPITPAMLEILQHDDRIDEAESCQALSLELTPLGETLRRCVGPESDA